jgi:hypothetical protein
MRSASNGHALLGPPGDNATAEQRSRAAAAENGMNRRLVDENLAESP